jgi:hypothetical protein
MSKKSNHNAQRNGAKESSRVASRFFWRIAEGAGDFLREMANLRDDGIVRFQQRYDPYFNRYEKSELLQLRDELRALWTGGKQMPETIAADWDEDLAAASGTLLEEWICNRWLRRNRGGLVILFGDIQADPYVLPALLAYSAHLCRKRMQVCLNGDCPAPYFVASRRDQRYCSHECAAPAMRAAKRRSWHRHKGQWLKQRKRTKTRRRTKQ